MVNSYLQFLDTMSIAMEADDITTQTASEVRNTIGGTPSTQTDEDTREDEENLEKVDDIFGTEETPGNNQNDTPSDNETDSGDEENIPSTEDDIQRNEEGTVEEDPNVTGDNTNEQDELSSESDDLLFTKKNRIRDNLAQLYTIISGNIEVIVNSLTNINDINTVNVMNIVINHLRNCKSYIYKTLTEEITTLGYDELLQRYITLKRVYDICIKMMETHFDVNNKERK